MTRLTGDVTAIQNSVATGLRPGLRSPIMMLTAMTASFLINPRLAMVFLVAAPILGIMLFSSSAMYGRSTPGCRVPWIRSTGSSRKI